MMLNNKNYLIHSELSTMTLKWHILNNFNLIFVYGEEKLQYSLYSLTSINNYCFCFKLF